MPADLTVLALAFGKAFLFVLAAILPILNPPATAPIFLTLTEGASPQVRAQTARRVARNAFMLLLGSMLVGSVVLDVFGISLPIVRVGGGMIVMAAAWRLLNATPQTTSGTAALGQGYTPEQARRQAFYPLTFPLSCGPGSISAAITVGVALHDGQLVMGVVRMGGALLALLVIAVLLYLALRYAHRLLGLLGESGAVVFLRLSAFIVLCLGVQITWDGLSVLLQGALAPLLQAPSQ
jgi:multiple antibiotic resistance protein